MNRVARSSIILLVVAAIFSTAYAAMSFEIGTRDIADPNKCISKQIEIAMEIRKEYQVPGKCGAMICDESFIISTATCGVIVVQGCQLSEIDLTKPYPDCCPKPICN